MTDTPTSMRERLARAAADATYDQTAESGLWPDDVEIDKQDYQNQMWRQYLGEVDAILSELAEPNETLCELAAVAVNIGARTEENAVAAADVQVAVRTVIQMIIDGG